MRSFVASLALPIVAAVALVASPSQTVSLMPIEDVRPGMIGVGRTVFAGTELEEFGVTVLGVMHNIIGPNRDLILARLDGGPLANTGVIQGMSGSPVYIDGRLVGAVSYSLGSFPKEPIAGLTPIAEMIADVGSRSPRPANADLQISWPATPAQVFEALGRVARRAAAPLGHIPAGARLVGPASLADFAPALRPIGATLTFSGFESRVASHLQQALQTPVQQAARTAAAAPATAPLRAGDPVGMSLVRGDLEMGATGTVTHVDGTRVYAFGHPFLNLGPTQLAMTEAHVFTVLPSLDSSMKLASLGNVIGTVTQDRATVVGGTLGAGPRELAVQLSLTSAGSPTQRFDFKVLNDPSLTPLFTYVALVNALTGWERQTGVMTLSAKGRVSFGPDAEILIDDVFTGPDALTAAAAAIAGPLGTLLPNTFREVTADAVTVEVATTEVEEYSTIERAWLDTTRPAFGGRYGVHVQLRDYRGGTRVITVPVTMPAHSEGPLTLLVADAATLNEMQRNDLRPKPAATWQELVERTRDTPRGNRIYVRLLAAGTGTVLAGDTMPALPGSVLSAVLSDSSAEKTPVSRTVVGSWDQRMDRLVRGSHELKLSLRPAR
jgi:hypothetical protein